MQAIFLTYILYLTSSFLILKTECIHRVKLYGYEEANFLIGEYINYYNNYRIQTKTELAPLEKRNQDGMNTKWNKLGFKLGLVGGHCISVDPYYLIDRAKKLGYESQVIASARKVNDNMGKYIANITISKLIETGQCLSDSKVVVLGFSFKENCSDIRNTRVYDIVKQLESSGIETLVVDPMVDKKVALFEYGININQISEVNDVNGIVAAVAHDEFKNIGINKIESLYGNISSEEKIFIDVKGLFSTEDLKALKLNYWRL